ncbi:hypothetical protein VCSRO22_0158 [Vibrio cholerae]|nr:hypothetical protein VCSRO22_0158 [Vibrio cholerae]
MELSLEVLGLLFLVAGVAGFIDAMAGGGGLLTLPALLAAGVPPTQALATNKLQSSFGSFSATLYFVRKGVVSLKAMRLAIACTFVGAALGAEAVQYIDATLLTSLIPLLLLGISLYFLLAPTTKTHTGPALYPKPHLLSRWVLVSVFMMAFLAPVQAQFLPSALWLWGILV